MQILVVQIRHENILNTCVLLDPTLAGVAQKNELLVKGNLGKLYYVNYIPPH